MAIIRIGTRKSKLALLQTKIVSEAIKKIDRNIQIELVPISTTGDKIQDVSLLKIGGKGVFTKELEEALLCGDIDLAVHSAKDIPLYIPQGLSISPVLIREEANDLVLTLTGVKLENLKEGSIVGTSSLRRQLQAKALNKDIVLKDLRGNVQTRIKKLLSGEYDAIILAKAGLNRLGLNEEKSDFKNIITENLELEKFLPAAGQGILAIEYRQDCFKDLIEKLKVKNTSLAFDIEREFLLSTGAGCNAPCGIYCNILDGICYIDIMYANSNLELKYEKLKVEEHRALEELKSLVKRLKKDFN